MDGEVGDEDGVEAGGVGGLDAGDGVFEGEAELGRDAEALGGEQVGLGVGLAAGDLVAGDEDVEQLEQAVVGELGLGERAAGGGGDGLGDAELAEELEALLGAGLEGRAFFEQSVVGEGGEAGEFGDVGVGAEQFG